MANSTSASLKLTVQATGENSGTWGQITNTNLLIVEQAIGGYDTFNLTNANRAPTFSNGAVSSSKSSNQIAGTLSTNVNVTIPDSKNFHCSKRCIWCLHSDVQNNYRNWSNLGSC